MSHGANHDPREVEVLQLYVVVIGIVMVIITIIHTQVVAKINLLDPPSSCVQE
jgi:hypothetical protein